MDITCPVCKAALKVGEKHHYRMIKCPRCANEFQALGRETVRLTKEYLEKMEKEQQKARQEAEKKAEKKAKKKPKKKTRKKTKKK